MSTYTEKQAETLATMKDPDFALGIARAEFVNHALEQDGSITSDLSVFSAKLSAAIAALVKDPTQENLAAATEAARLNAEITEHIAQARFLFIVGPNGLPLIYFQCATETNPDLPPRVVEAQ
jgi:hypothetical protein